MRLLKLGAPEKTKKYVIPGVPGRGVLLGSLAVATAIALVVLALNFAGLKRLASPGPLASAHAPLDAKCDDCHARNVAADLRCERCHDPAATDAWRVSTHASWNAAVSPFPAASAGTARAPKVHPVRCAECHQDHRGRAFPLTRVDERNCAVCHKGDTPSLARHVEFGVVRAGKTPARGMKISHDRHIKEALARMLGKKKGDELTEQEKKVGLVGQTLQRTCETCHVSTSDLRGFEPIDYDRHCQKCHIRKAAPAATDPMPIADVVPPDKINEPWAVEAAAKMTTRRDKIAKTEILHADPWILFNLAKIRREVDPAGYLADRSSLVRRIQESERAGASFALSAANDAQLAKRETALVNQIAELKKRIAAAKKASEPGTLAATLAPYDGAAAALVAANAGAPPATPAPGVATTPAGDAKAAADSVNAARVRAGSGEGAAPLSASDASARRAELLSVLDALRRRAAASNDVLLARRVDALARRVGVYRPGRSGVADLEERLTSLQIERERITDERDYLRRAKQERTLLVSRVADRLDVDAGAAAARARLEAMALVDAQPAAPLDPAQRTSRLSTVESLLVACVKCHETGVASLARLSIDAPVMPQAVFDHRPHVRVMDCAGCHAMGGKGVLTSKKPSDVMVPDVASCRTCHKPSGARAACETCHRFHPSGYPARVAPRDPSTMLVARVGGGR